MDFPEIRPGRPEPQGSPASVRCDLSAAAPRLRPFADLGVDLQDLQRLVLEDPDPRGHGDLRREIAALSGVEAHQVLVTPGGSAGRALLHRVLPGPGGHGVLARPGEARFLRPQEGPLSFLDLRFEEGYRTDLHRLGSLVRPDTELVSLSCPQAPTGACLDEEDLRGAAALAESRGFRLLVDETGRELRFAGPLPAAASLSSRALSLGGLDPVYGVPALRVGWILCPDPDLYARLLEEKGRLGLGGGLEEPLGLAALRRRGRWLPDLRVRLAEAFRVLREWMEGQELLRWVPPQGGFTAFPRLDPGLDPKRFVGIAAERYGVLVAPGSRFGAPEGFFRLGFGAPDPEELETGLARLTAAAWDLKEES